MSNPRQCPDCGERLSIDALRCACGWGAKKTPGVKHFDMRCTYAAGSSRCCYPVGMFPEGKSSGWCIFHRQNLSSFDGAEIVRQSETVAYSDAIAAILERGANAPAVVDTAWDIALRHGNRPWQTGTMFAAPGKAA